MVSFYFHFKAYTRVYPRLCSPGRIVRNIRYADDIILLATSEAELQELVESAANTAYSSTSTRPR